MGLAGLALDANASIWWASGPSTRPPSRGSRIVDVAISPHFRIPARPQGGVSPTVKRTRCQRASVPPTAAPSALLTRDRVRMRWSSAGANAAAA
jgi:hypothetical protein